MENIVNRPSLFKYATKELSQDAFFCWLLEWSEEKYKNSDLYGISKNFLKNIIGKDITVDTIRIKRQYLHIDILAIINEKLFISFEDKINSKIHGNQLKIYKETLEKKHKNPEKIFVYIKTDLIMEEEKKNVEKNGYIVLDIFTLYTILLSQPKNDIYQDFFSKLSKKVNSLSNFENVEKNKWQPDEWRGFIYKLSSKIKYTNFWEFYKGDNNFGFILEKIDNFPVENVNMTLGIEKKRFLIKFHFGSKVVKRLKIRSEFFEKYNKIFNDFKINKNSRIGNKSATIITFKDYMKFNEENLFDFEKTVEYIEKVRIAFFDLFCCSAGSYS